MRKHLLTIAVAVILSAGVVHGQQTPPPPAPEPQPQSQPAPAVQPAPQPAPAPAPAPAPQTPVPPPANPAAQDMQPPSQQPGILSRAAAGSYERRDTLPSVNVYIPEGEASVRLRKLIRNVLFESQITYKFINGDISTFLRYKYYARNFTYKISVFDSIGFPDVTGASASQFERTRGGLFLAEFPRDYNHRYFWLVEDDRLTFGDVTNPDNKRNNVYTKVSYQYGTQFDDRLNQIAGEARGQLTPVLTAFRDIGPQKFSLAAALTESAHISTGSYKYTKVEAEAIRRFDLTQTSFVVTRAHAGLFPTKSTNPDTSLPQIARYSIPNYEMFTLGGRDALKGVGSNDSTTGINEFHLTNEFFTPVFRNKDKVTGALHWNTLYAIAYAGFGNVGYGYTDMFKPSQMVVDAGIGFESALLVRDYDVLLSIIYAHTLHAPLEMRGGKVRFSVRTVR